MPRIGFAIDNRACIGCHACTVACKSEHDVPIGAQIVARRGREDLLLRLAAELEGAGALARS